MKISQKQASLLAKEVHNQLKKLNVGEVSELVKAKIRNFKEERAKLLRVCEVADAALSKHDEQFEKLVGLRNVYHTDSITRILDRMKEVNIPTLSQIEDRIVLKSMFATDGDMESFVAAIVKEFTKKKLVTAN